MRLLIVAMLVSSVAHADPYDELVGKLADAGRVKDDEQAAARYRDVANAAKELLARAPSKLAAKIKALEARAETLGDAANDRFIEKLEAELHAVTPGQRAVVLAHGRPAVAKKKALTCWIYRDDSSEETYCWTKASKLAEHTTTPKPKRKPSHSYYAAATPASGSCKYNECMKYGWSTETPEGTVVTECKYNECMKYGWTSTYPDDTEATTECKYSECMKSGWTTTMPDGSEATTECKYGECMTSGWTTTMPDGSEATTECKYRECLKHGWTTELPSHKSVTCSCTYNECLEHGATCE